MKTVGLVPLRPGKYRVLHGAGILFELLEDGTQLILALLIPQSVFEVQPSMFVRGLSREFRTVEDQDGDKNVVLLERLRFMGLPLTKRIKLLAPLLGVKGISRSALADVAGCSRENFGRWCK